MNEINIPIGAKAILQGLKWAHYDAFLVGGCVRDGLMGVKPKDWDICTSATPDEMKAFFASHGVRTIDTGIKHGTITANMEEAGCFEVTTFRIDGSYSDGRHPDEVKFTDNIEQDLSRRDFTINAMACNEDGLVDPFGGVNDLKNKIIRCVGNPDERFEEDALRILRAMRFSAIYNFSIEEKTSLAIHQNKDKLLRISAERIQSEITKMICGKNILQVLLDYSDVIAVVFPEMNKCIGFNQNNRFHQYDVYEHIAHAVSNYTGKDPIVAMTLLLHDIGKPDCYTVDHKGGHFHGHGARSHDISSNILTRLRFDNKSKRQILELVLYHDSVIEPTMKTVCRWLNKIGQVQFERLLDVRMADIKAHSIDTQASRIERCNSLRVICDEVIRQQQCFQLKDLAIDGHDVMCLLGIKEGPGVGSILNEILGLVLNGDLENKRSCLVKYLKSRCPA